VSHSVIFEMLRAGKPVYLGRPSAA
jgi:hypothetical protein